MAREEAPDMDGGALNAALRRTLTWRELRLLMLPIPFTVTFALALALLFGRGIGAEYENGCALEGDGEGGMDVKAERPLRSGRAGDLGGRTGGW